jgi:ribosomal protein S18 acetylase RimI-like enzyme
MERKIRPFRQADLPLIKAITVEAFEGVSIDRNIEEQFGLINGHDWEWRKGREIEEDVAKDAEGVFVAEEAALVVGYITTWMDHEAGVGFIHNLAVSARSRGQGIGRKLIEHALDHFRKHGIPYARIETLEQNQAGQKLYPAFGFREVARQIHYCMPLAQ